MERVIGFLGIEAEEGPVQEAASARAGPPWTEADERRGRLVSLPGNRRSPEAQALSVVVQKPTRFDEVQAVVNCLKDRRPVILSVEAVQKDVAQRLVDFVSGAVYALEGRMHRLSESLFLFTPSNVGIDVAQDEEDDWEV
ncbi:MAG: cell division protein SepF [Firmicutes bacterium]|nr:cell division protein SepF [Bacillota bacterium]